MNRLDEVRPPVYRQPRLALAASLALLVAAWVGFHRWQSSLEEQQTNARVRSIKSEVQQLQNDIRLLRNLAPVLYLGGDENVDFVLDLRQLARESGGENRSPVSYGETNERSEKGKIYNE
jgi:hypothetical protein